MGNKPVEQQFEAFSKNEKKPSSVSTNNGKFWKQGLFCFWFTYYLRENVFLSFQLLEPAFSSLTKGVEICDLVVGDGPHVKQKDSVKISYSVSLVGNEQISLSIPDGNPVNVDLNQRDVIGGFKVGILGMQVGGIRAIRCPTKCAYGAKGYPPFIPPNSDVVFQVKLSHIGDWIQNSI